MPPAPKLLATLVLLAGLAPFGPLAMAAAGGSGPRDPQSATSAVGAGSDTLVAPSAPGGPPATVDPPGGVPAPPAEPPTPFPAGPVASAPPTAGSAPTPGDGEQPAAPEPPEPDASDATTAPADPDPEREPQREPTPPPPRSPSEMPAGEAFDEPAEGEFLSLTNSSRHAAGVAALAWDHELTAYARRHARYLATNGHLEHSDIRSLLHAWSTVGENVGVGPSVSTIQDALLASPDHYRNLADPLFTHVGVGVYVDAEGRTWTAHVFGV